MHHVLATLILALLIPAQMARLGSTSFHSRERAHGVLAQSMPHAKPYLECGLKHIDPEISARCNVLLANWWRGETDRRFNRLSRKPFPWIDMLPDDYPDRYKIHNYYLELGRLHTVKCGPCDWTEYREATRLYVMDLVRSKGNVQEIEALLKGMENRGIDWWEKNRERYSK